MGAAARALGMGSELEFEGKTWKLCGWTEGVKALYEMYLERHALGKARSLRHSLPPEELMSNDPVAIAQRDISVGLYDYGTKLWGESLKAPRHLKMAILIQLQESHPEADKALVDRMFEKSIDDAIFAYQQADSDPNGKTPAPTAGE